MLVGVGLGLGGSPRRGAVGLWTPQRGASCELRGGPGPNGHPPTRPSDLGACLFRELGPCFFAQVEKQV